MPKASSRIFRELLRAFRVVGAGDEQRLPLATTVTPVVRVDDYDTPPTFGGGFALGPVAVQFGLVELHPPADEQVQVRGVGNGGGGGAPRIRVVTVPRAQALLTAAANVAVGTTSQGTVAKSVVRAATVAGPLPARVNSSGISLFGTNPFALSFRMPLGPDQVLQIWQGTANTALDANVVWQESLAR